MVWQSSLDGIFNKIRFSVFFYFCRHFSQGSTPTRIQRDAFTTSDFNNWKRALARNKGFDKHVISQTHIISSANFLQYQSRKKNQYICY